MNYFLENRDGNPETLSLRKDERNSTSLELDAHWEVNYFEINPPHIVVDSRRNWCEVLLRRAHLDPSAPRSADELLSAIDSLEFGSQVWFQQVWIALWRFPTRRLVDRFLAGIKGFSRGSVPVRETRKRFGAPAPSFDSLGEVQYWRARRDNLPE